MERTVVLVKPDGVQRALIGEIINRFENKGLKLVGIKMISLEDSLLENWYAHHKDKPFFPGLRDFMKSYPVIAMAWQGYEGIAAVRKIVGVTKSRDADPGTIRGDFGMSQQYNLIHASEDEKAAKKELDLIFDEHEIFDWDKTLHKHIYLPEEE